MFQSMSSFGVLSESTVKGLITSSSKKTCDLDAIHMVVDWMSSCSFLSNAWYCQPFASNRTFSYSVENCLSKSTLTNVGLDPIFINFRPAGNWQFISDLNYSRTSTNGHLSTTAISLQRPHIFCPSGQSIH